MLRDLMQAVYLDNTMDASLAAVKGLLSTPGIDIVTLINLETKDTDAEQPEYALFNDVFYGRILGFYAELVQVTPLLLAMLCNNSAVFTYLLEQGAVLRPEYLSVYLRHQKTPDYNIIKVVLANLAAHEPGYLYSNTKEVVFFRNNDSPFPYSWSLRYSDSISYYACSLFALFDRNGMSNEQSIKIIELLRSSEIIPLSTVVARCYYPNETLTLEDILAELKYYRIDESDELLTAPPKPFVFTYPHFKVHDHTEKKREREIEEGASAGAGYPPRKRRG